MNNRSSLESNNNIFKRKASPNNLIATENEGNYIFNYKIRKKTQLKI